MVRRLTFLTLGSSFVLLEARVRHTKACVPAGDGPLRTASPVDQVLTRLTKTDAAILEP
jgi:hypothetical protein